MKAYEDVIDQHMTDQRATRWEWHVAMTFVPDPKHEWEIANV